jgi:hypothetical protein
VARARGANSLALFRDLLALGRREAEHIAHAFPEVSRRVGGYLIDALVPANARQPRDAAVRLGGHAGRLAPHRDQAVAAAEEQGARHLPLRHLPQGHGGGPAHRQARARRRRGGRSHADRAGPRHRHVPPGDGTYVRGSADALLLVEFAEDDQAENLRRLERLDELMGDLGTPGSVVKVPDAAGQKAVWEVRASASTS